MIHRQYNKTCVVSGQTSNDDCSTDFRNYQHFTIIICFRCTKTNIWYEKASYLYLTSTTAYALDDTLQY